MTPDKVKEMIDACFQAKRIRDMLPVLPKSITPSHIHYLDVINNLSDKGLKVKVSDISNKLGLPKPPVTRTIKEMEETGLIKKNTSEDDARVIYIEMTNKGIKLYKKYNLKYYEELSKELEFISINEANIMIKTINNMYNTMKERGNK